MAFPVVQNTQTNSVTVASSVTVTKPTSLAVGDILIGSVSFFQSGGSRTFNTPAGWTEQRKVDGSNTGLALYTKIADASDVSASDFTFTISGSADVLSVSLSRVDTYSSIGSSEIDEAATPNATVATFTTNITPTVSENLIYMAFCGSDATYTGTPSVSAYGSTPSETWTEIADIGTKNGASLGLGLGVATANNSDITNITSREATFNDTINSRWASVIIIIEGIINATGTNALLAVSPFLPNQNGVAGTTGTNAIHTSSPTFFDQSGRGTSPTQWENEEKSNTTWINEQL